MAENEIIKGRATPLGTKRLADRFKMDGYYRRGQGFTLSSIGLGTYLGEMDDGTDQAVEAAVEAAYDAGINVYDTAINYRGQRAERSLGRALARLIENEQQRAEILVCTKGGFLPIDGERTVDPTTYIRQQYIDTDIITASDIYGSGQCYTPGFLEHCIDLSLKNLGIETIDVYYLHNVEFVRPQMGEEKFGQMLRAAFERLEEMVVRRKIGYYGIASWVAFRGNPRHQGHLELEALCDLAQSIAGQGHHFRFVQAPFSLMMPEAIDLETQRVGGEWMRLVDAADRLRIGLVGSSSLGSGNLIGRWNGVAESQCDLVAGMTPAQQALQFARSVPGFLTNLVGMKNPAHVEENLALFSGSRPWESEELGQFMSAASGE